MLTQQITMQVTVITRQEPGYVTDVVDEMVSSDDAVIAMNKLLDVIHACDYEGTLAGVTFCVEGQESV